MRWLSVNRVSVLIYSNIYVIVYRYMSPRKHNVFSRTSLGELTEGYEKQPHVNYDQLLDLDESGIWRTDEGDGLLYRLQRTPDNVSNVRPGKNATLGLYGQRIGLANRRDILASASGYVDSHKFEWEFAYYVPEEIMRDAVDMRLRSIGRRALFDPMKSYAGPLLGRSLLDIEDELNGRALIAGRPMAQRILDPKRAKGQPPVFFHLPHVDHKFLQVVGVNNRMQ